MATSVDEHFTAHSNAIDDLHDKLAALPGTDTTKLDGAVAKYKASYAQFVEDAKGCMN